MTFQISFGMTTPQPHVVFGGRTLWFAPGYMRQFSELAHPEGKRWAIHRDEEDFGSVYVYAGPLLIVIGELGR